MGKLSSAITDEHKKFIQAQKMFFVATAPLSTHGHINVSPKGLEHLQVIDENKVAYLDFVGSGNETSAHVLENQRITFMFCSFDKVPNILRLYGKGAVILPHQPEWQTYVSRFEAYAGVRQIVVAEIYHVQTSCGFGVPMYEFIGDRQILFEWAAKKGDTGIQQYQQEKNLFSLDELPTHLNKR